MLVHTVSSRADVYQLCEGKHSFGAKHRRGVVGMGSMCEGKALVGVRACPNRNPKPQTQTQWRPVGVRALRTPNPKTYLTLNPELPGVCGPARTEIRFG
jgi:hypothetical protein